MLFRGLSAVVLAVLAFQLVVKLRAPEAASVEDEVFTEELLPKKSSAKRSPASTKKKLSLSPSRPHEKTGFGQRVGSDEMMASNSSETQGFAPEEVAPAESAPMAPAISESVPDAPDALPGYDSDDDSDDNDRSPSSAKKDGSAKTASTGSTGVGMGMGFSNIGLLPKSQAPVNNVLNPVPTATSHDSKVGISCSATIDEGIFVEPIEVQIQCSHAANIKYCLSETGCCDPSSGVAYSAPIEVGVEPKEYCLSYYAVSTNGSVSSVKQVTYSFEPAIPDLTTSLTRTFYQTTNLPTMPLDILSDNFGEDTHSLGQINFKSRDPSALSCEEVMTDYSSLTAPVPLEIMALLNLSTLDPAIPYETPFDLAKLSYGNNFIVSYIQNNIYPTVGSCKKDLVVLKDFEFFSPMPSHSVAGSPTAQEFAGEFVAYGFFEPTIDILPRSPAGSGAELQTDQELRSGLMSIFF